VKTTLAILVKPDDGNIRDVEHIRRLRADCEAKMTPDFDLSLSLEIDRLVQQEEGQS